MSGASWKYLKYVVKHKWLVSVECFKHGIWWRGLTHDLSKFRPSEFRSYARHFYGDGTGIKTGRDSSGYYSPGVTEDEAFNFSWLLHQKRNDHHWQWWWLKRDDGGERSFRMSRPAMLEMVCDWVGAGIAISGTRSPKDDPYRETRKWYRKSKGKLLLHEDTREEVERMIGYKEGVE